MMTEGKNVITVLYLDTSSIFSGAESSLVQLIKYLDRDRFRPVLCFLCPEPHHDLYADANVEVRYLTEGPDGWMGSDYWRLLPRGSDFVRRIILGKLLSSLAKREGADIVHVNLLWPKPFWFLWWPKTLRFPTIGHARSYPGGLPSKRVQKACTSIIHVSKFVQAGARKKFVHPCSYQIYDPIETDRYKSDKDARKARQTLGLDPCLRVISSVGLLSPHKGHDVAIMAFAKIAKAIEDVALYIAGGGNDAEQRRLEGMASECGVSEKVIFSGDQLRNVEDVYAASEFVYSLTKCGEAFGRVPLEVGAAGKPVIVTILGAAPELVVDGKTGYLVNPSDVEKIVELSIKLLKQPDLCEKVGMCARSYVESHFVPRQHAAAVEEVYRGSLSLQP